MPAEEFREERHFLPKDQLLEYGALTVIRGASAGLPGIASWLSGRLRKDPIPVFDLNGKALFFDFQVLKGTAVLGYVRTAASKVLGPPVVSLQVGSRSWDFESAARKASTAVKREFPRARLGAPRLVCYSYPKLGVMFEVPAGTGTRRVIYDVASLARVEERPERPAIEGAYAWSLYDALADDERRTRLQVLAKHERARAAVPAAVRAAIPAARSLTVVADALRWRWRKTVTKQLEFCGHYAATHARSHHCFCLHGQQVNDYCAVATCQMILCYYRYCYTQSDIAPNLGYAPGGCPADQSPGYKKLSCEHLTATFISSPTWDQGRDAIDARHPFKSGITGHARACAGYSYTQWLVGGITDRQLYIYDPWPWNADLALAGTVYWEDWDSIAHTNYVTTGIKCP